MNTLTREQKIQIVERGLALLDGGKRWHQGSFMTGREEGVGDLHVNHIVAGYEQGECLCILGAWVKVAQEIGLATGSENIEEILEDGAPLRALAREFEIATKRWPADLNDNGSGFGELQAVSEQFLTYLKASA